MPLLIRSGHRLRSHSFGAHSPAFSSRRLSAEGLAIAFSFIAFYAIADSLAEQSAFVNGESALFFGKIQRKHSMLSALRRSEGFMKIFFFQVHLSKAGYIDAVIQKAPMTI